MNPSLAPPLTNADAIKVWLTELPLTSLNSSAQQVLGALRRLNGSDAAPQSRHRAMELFREAAHDLTARLKRLYWQAALPLPRPAAQAAALVQALQTELAAGYQQTAEDWLEQDGLHRGPDLLASAWQRALSHQGQVILACAQTHGQIRIPSWLAIHRLYQEAEGKGLLLSRVKDRVLGTDSAIDTTYKQLLLLTLASPICRAPEEAEAVYAALREGAALCRLYSPVELGEPPGTFAVDLAAAAPPRLFLPALAPLSAAVRTLDTRALVQTLRDRLQGTWFSLSWLRKRTRAAAWAALSHDLVRRLVLVWGVPSRRGHTRALPQAAEVQTVVGLHATYRMLSGFSPGPRTAGGRPRRPRARLSPSPRRPGPEVYRCPVLDAGVQGARLHWGTDPLGKLKVGELIAVRSDREEGAWRVAVVRWLQWTPAETLEFGLQLLTPGATPLQIWRHDEGATSPGLYGLLLPAHPRSRQPGSVLLPRLCRSGDTLLTRSATHEQRLRLEGRLEETPAYTHFRYTPLEAVRPVPAASPGPARRRKRPRTKKAARLTPMRGTNG